MVESKKDEAVVARPILKVQGVAELNKINESIADVENLLSNTSESSELTALYNDIRKIVEKVKKEVNGHAGVGYALCYKKNKNYQLDADEIVKALCSLSDRIEKLSKSGEGYNEERYIDHWRQVYRELDSALAYRPTKKHFKRSIKIRNILSVVLVVCSIIAAAAITITFLLLSPFGAIGAGILGFMAGCIGGLGGMGISHLAILPKKIIINRKWKHSVDWFSKKIGIADSVNVDDFFGKVRDVFVEQSCLARDKRIASEKQTRDRVIAEREKAVTAPYQKGADGKSPAYEAVEKNRVEKLAFVEGEIVSVDEGLQRIQAEIDAVEVAIQRASGNVASALEELIIQDKRNNNRFINEKTTLEEFERLEKNPGDYNRAFIAFVRADLAQKKSRCDLLEMKGLLEQNKALLNKAQQKIQNENVWDRVGKYENEKRAFDRKHSYSIKVIRKSPDRFNARNRLSSVGWLSVKIGDNTHRLFASSSRKMTRDLVALRQEKLPGDKRFIS